MIPTENENLFIVEKNNKYGVYHKDLGLLFHNKYDSVQVLGNIVYIENEDVGYLLYNAQKIIKEFDKSNDSYCRRYELYPIS